VYVKLYFHINVCSMYKMNIEMLTFRVFYATVSLTHVYSSLQYKKHIVTYSHVEEAVLYFYEEAGQL